jgi:hypothetical protein
MKALGPLAVCLFCIATALFWRNAFSQETSPSASLKPAKNSPTAPKVLYRDIAAQAGLTAHDVSGSAVDRKYILESTGSGVGLLDFDGDGFLDIFLGNGTTLETPQPGQEPPSTCTGTTVMERSRTSPRKPIPKRGYDDHIEGALWGRRLDGS